MAARKRPEKNGTSPYQKYKKVPFHYSFKQCAHKNSTRQSTPTWSGRVCTVCGIITHSDDEPSRRAADG